MYQNHAILSGRLEDLSALKRSQGGQTYRTLTLTQSLGADASRRLQIPLLLPPNHGALAPPAAAPVTLLGRINPRGFQAEALYLTAQNQNDLHFGAVTGRVVGLNPLSQNPDKPPSMGVALQTAPRGLPLSLSLHGELAAYCRRVVATGDHLLIQGCFDAGLQFQPHQVGKLWLPQKCRARFQRTYRTTAACGPAPLKRPFPKIPRTAAAS
ncbi:hypothetical protein [Acanthopleuribacter pedis]|uniref:Uncharacterized protein n=1 Tax=Acanthopleuribacter pedis TaxID=442870 RepID=A0A8J7U471_9BACT|nr:hypothetical protein [Acanthopleuribacter pedis]MBO1320342.1 hypothetical protein [Acanthopleuribacter pedis]